VVGVAVFVGAMGISTKALPNCCSLSGLNGARWFVAGCWVTTVVPSPPQPTSNMKLQQNKTISANLFPAFTILTSSVLVLHRQPL
jgi:hypothetical protein